MRLPKEYDGYTFNKSFLNKILKFVYPPSMNARNAKGYSFSVIKNKSGRLDCEGG